MYNKNYITNKAFNYFNINVKKKETVFKGEIIIFRCNY